MVKYSKAVEFTDKQINCMERLRTAMRDLRRCGCKIVANGTYVSIYKVKDFRNSDLRGERTETGLSNYRVPCWDIEQLDSISSYEDRFYKKGYITENNNGKRN